MRTNKTTVLPDTQKKLCVLEDLSSENGFLFTLPPPPLPPPPFTFPPQPPPFLTFTDWIICHEDEEEEEDDENAGLFGLFSQRSSTTTTVAPADMDQHCARRTVKRPAERRKTHFNICSNDLPCSSSSSSSARGSFSYMEKERSGLKRKCPDMAGRCTTATTGNGTKLIPKANIRGRDGEAVASAASAAVRLLRRE